MLKKIFVSFLSVLFVFISCKSIPEARERITVNGMIYDTDNRPAVNYRIYVDDEFVAITDIGGRFNIENIKRGYHSFHGEGKGYLSIDDSINIFDETQVLYLRVPTVEEKFIESFELLKEGKFDKAKELINLVLNSDVENTDALFFMSVIDFLNGNKNEAINKIEQIKNLGENGTYVEELEKIISK